MLGADRLICIVLFLKLANIENHIFAFRAGLMLPDEGDDHAFRDSVCNYESLCFVSLE